MAVIKAISSKANLKRIINYVTRENKTTPNLITGKDCLAESSLEEMQYVKGLYKKTDGRQYIHLIQSFSPEDKATKEQIHNLGLKLVEKFKGHQVLVATHIDREHTHNHLIINSVNFENGKKIQMSKKDLQEIKDFSDDLCREIGLSVIEKRENAQYLNTKEYGVAQRGESWKFKLINAIDTAMQNSSTKNEFIKNINKLGYQVNWTDTRKYITYTTPEGMKCRDNKLFDSKYLKGEMENRYTRIKENESSIEATRGSSTNNTDGILLNRSKNIRGYVQMEGTDKPKYDRNSGYSKTKSGENERADKEYDKRGDFLYDGQEKISTGGTTEARPEVENKMDDNRSSAELFDIISILPSQRVNNRTQSNVRRYKGELSKQAKKEYAIKMRNASSFKWEQDEEAEM